MGVLAARGIRRLLKSCAAVHMLTAGFKLWSLVPTSTMHACMHPPVPVCRVFSKEQQPR